MRERARALASVLTLGSGPGGDARSQLTHAQTRTHALTHWRTCAPRIDRELKHAVILKTHRHQVKLM